MSGRSGNWTAREVVMLERSVETSTCWDDVAKLIPIRSANACRKKAAELGITHTWKSQRRGVTAWLDSELAILRRLYLRGLTVKQISEHFPQHTYSSCYHQYQKIGRAHKALPKAVQEPLDKLPYTVLRMSRQGYTPAQIFTICKASDAPELRALSRYDISRMTSQYAKPARREFTYKKTG